MRICFAKFPDSERSLKVAFHFAIARRTHRKNLWQSFQLICALHFSLCQRHKYAGPTRKLPYLLTAKSFLSFLSR